MVSLAFFLTRSSQFGCKYSQDSKRKFDKTLFSDSRFISLFVLAHNLPLTERITQTLPKRKIGQDMAGECTICWQYGSWRGGSFLSWPVHDARGSKDTALP